MIRNPNQDKLKSHSTISKELDSKCIIDKCGQPLTQMQGPGCNVLCRKHQLSLREYGGMGRIDRPHTFHRKMYCEECGWSPWDDTNNKYYYLSKTDPGKWNRICRSKLVADHQQRQADNGDHSEENIKTLCLLCNSDKTIFCEDFKPSRISTISCNGI